MTAFHLDAARVFARANAEELRRYMVMHAFGELAVSADLPSAVTTERGFSSLDEVRRTEWRRAVAEELLLRHAFGLTIPGDWASRFADTAPLEDEVPLRKCLSQPAACAMFPLALSGHRPGAGHAWVLGEQEPAFVTTVTRADWGGVSWQLAAEVARRALHRGDREFIRSLALNWILTGTCEGNRVEDVAIGNKLSLAVNRKWILPASILLGATSRRLRIYRAATVDSALNIIAGRGFQTAASRGIPSPVDVLHSFVSTARLPVLHAALATRPKRVLLWCSAEFRETGTHLRESILPRFLPDAEIAPVMEADSRDLARIEQQLHPALERNAMGGASVVFNITNGNLLQRIAAVSIARMYPSTLLVYRDKDNQGTDLTTLSYEAEPPITCPESKAEISPTRVNLEALTNHDDGKQGVLELLDALEPEIGSKQRSEKMG